MTKIFTEFTTNALLKVSNHKLLKTFNEPKQIGLFTFIISKETALNLIIDGIPFTLKPYQIITITPIQFFKFVDGKNCITYQFNREFYCIKDHDKEVGCAGLLFFGNNYTPVITLNKKEQDKFNKLHLTILDEIDTQDTIQAEMLRMLITSFIINTTRLFKNSQKKMAKPTNDILRHYNFLVETHFKEAHQVSFYAGKLNKSPKTLSNYFAKLKQSPLQIIHKRLILEVKRQLMYTDKSIKEIAFNIGFVDPSLLSRLFKKQTGFTLSEFKKQLQKN